MNPAADRGGNGDYKKHLSHQTCQWLSTVAQSDIRAMHQCQTREQFMQLWKLTRQAWIEFGEDKMAEIFSNSYIEDTNFNTWFYMASGIPGCVPDNNPIESHNRLVKGTPNFIGYITSGRSMTAVLNNEFPQMVNTASLERVSPCVAIPILDFDRAFKNTEFMSFWEQFDINVDAHQYRNGWLSNDIQYLSMEITDESVKRMEAALQGNLDVPVWERHEIRNATQRFHFTTWERHPHDNEEMYCSCNCYRYYYERWCYNSALFQHRQRMEKDGKRFPNSHHSQKRITRKALDQMALKEALARKRQPSFGGALEKQIKKKNCSTSNSTSEDVSVQRLHASSDAVKGTMQPHIEVVGNVDDEVVAFGSFVVTQTQEDND
jgi:hypothetical protein